MSNTDQFITKTPDFRIDLTECLIGDKYGDLVYGKMVCNTCEREFKYKLSAYKHSCSKQASAQKDVRSDR
jgi:hypothetical protein